MKNNSINNKAAIYRRYLSILLAAAVKKMFPECHPVSGKETEHGLYYDFYFSEGKKVTQGDFEGISIEIQNLIKNNHCMEFDTIASVDCENIFSENPFKLSILNEMLINGIDSYPICKLNDFIELCDIELPINTRDLNSIAWKLDSLSGAYWKNDEKNPMLYRINAVCFMSSNELNEYLKARAAAIENDHRKLGQELELFTSSNLVGKGLPMLLPKGAMLRMLLERFIVDEELKRGYLSVYTPPIAALKLFETSGHWQFYQDSMYPPFEISGEKYMLRPTSCPHHIMIYNDKPRSYRELPMRIGEIASLYRKEQSGELSGLVRIMHFTLADAHIFCTPEQAKAEFIGAVRLIEDVMQILGIESIVSYRASLSDDNKEKYFDNPEMWDYNEKLLLEILDEMELKYDIGYGEAAFYGPKLDVQMRNIYGKEETVFTVQIDSYLPERFEIGFINEKGIKQTPLMIHRSSVGCIERTMAFLIEYYKGAFPSWLAPTQIKLLTVNEKHISYAAEVERQLRASGFRIESDYRDEKLGKKIREARLMKIPYLIIIGENEMSSNSITVRNRDSGNQRLVKLDAFVSELDFEIKNHSLKLNADNSSEDPYSSWNMLHI